MAWGPLCPPLNRTCNLTALRWQNSQINYSNLHENRRLLLTPAPHPVAAELPLNEKPILENRPKRMRLHIRPHGRKQPSHTVRAVDKKTRSGETNDRGRPGWGLGRYVWAGAVGANVKIQSIALNM